MFQLLRQFFKPSRAGHVNRGGESGEKILQHNIKHQPAQLHTYDVGLLEGKQVQLFQPGF